MNGHLTRTPIQSSDHAAVTVMTVDDQAVFRSAARDVIAATPGFVCAGEAASGEEALRLAATARPRVALVDVRMPGMDGVQTARRMSAAHPDVVVVLISLEEPEPVAVLDESGADAFVRKQDFTPAALSAVWAEHGGDEDAAAGI